MLNSCKRVNGSGSLPASPADSGVSDVESSTSSGGNEDANLLLKARLNPNSSLQPSLTSHHSHLSSALGRSACHSPGVYPSTAGFLPPSYHPHQHHPSQYHPHRGTSPHNQHGNHSMGAAMGPPHHHHHHQTQSLQHLHYRQPPTYEEEEEEVRFVPVTHLTFSDSNVPDTLPALDGTHTYRVLPIYTLR
ncbi:hypothetical protein M0802_002098 [Mischocyttarus mexicanus]|nr:hypothetical protein M0802_002098 [Mischocyttarus mexicanus]